MLANIEQTIKTTCKQFRCLNNSISPTLIN